MKRNPYASFLDQVEKPARYIGSEFNEIVKDWNAICARMCLCFPDAYEVGMGHLGFKILYDELNREPDLLAERAFTPWPDMEAKMRERALPLVALESMRPLSDFDVLGFSLQYEMSYTNILTMLDLGGVSLLQRERAETAPFVIGGGPGATHPEPLAHFFDAFLIGDGEELTNKLLRFIGESRRRGDSRQTILDSLATWEAIYVPSRVKTKHDGRFEVVVDRRIRRHIVRDLTTYAYPVTSPVPHLTALFDRFAIEIARGCNEGCRFCQAGVIYRPARERHPRTIMDAAQTGLRCGGLDDVSLTALSTADYSAVTPLTLQLLDVLSKDNATLGVSSLRAYGLDPAVLDKMGEAKHTTLTFAPEAGSERLRRVINKNVTEEDLLQTTQNVFRRGWDKMKLYFMIGLPTETDEDVDMIMETASRMWRAGRAAGSRNPTITTAVSSFVPKPHTPFQWEAMISKEEIERKQQILYLAAQKRKLQFRKHVSAISHLEGLITRGDRRIGDLILLAWKNGARFDGWDECHRHDVWMAAIAELGIDMSLYLGAIPLDQALPWDHIDVGVTKAYMRSERDNAYAEALSFPCSKWEGERIHPDHLAAYEGKGSYVCHQCGLACNLKTLRDERKRFLNDLGAVQKTEYVPPDQFRKHIRDVREHRGQFVGETYRFEYTKIGPISFISQLDLQKVIGRIFKRAGVPVLYSEGHNTHPLLSFGPALSLGISSLSEWVDVRVQEELPTDLIAILNRHAERGIVFRTIQRITRSTPSIQEHTRGFEYWVPLLTGGASQLGPFLSQETWMLQSYSKEKKREIEKDLRPFVLSMQWAEVPSIPSEFRSLIEETSPLGAMGVVARIRVDQGRTIRPSELVALLARAQCEALRPIRTSTIFLL